MPLPIDAVSSLLGDEIVQALSLSGGDVAEAFRVELASGTTRFVKTHANPPPHFFDTEARGLEWLRESQTARVPHVIASSNEPPLLVLEWIDESRTRPRDDESFGRQLAAMHRSGAPGFGRDDGRTTGSRGLPNDLCETWPEFFATQRLAPLCRLARDEGVFTNAELAAIESVSQRLDVLGGPAEPAARLHGDLWAGNRIVDSAGQSWLIDPACHGGHREFDLAMMRLFGGFSEAVFAAYDEAYPLHDGWQQRVGLHQLAPLLVHAIKFGGGYRQATLDAAARLN